MIAKIKERYLQIVVTILCLCMLGGIQGKEARAASGYPLLQKVQTAENGSFVKTWGGWRYMYQDGTYPKKTWKKIKSNVFYFDKYGYMQTGWRQYKKSWYYLRTGGKKKGMLCKGWKTIAGKRYYFSKKTGARVTGFETIGKHLYYFNKKGVLQKGKTVGKYRLDPATGEATEITENTDGTGAAEGSLKGDVGEVHIFVGDSRTVGLGAALGAISYDNLLQQRIVQANVLTEYYLAKVGSGYEWYSEKALPKLNELLQRNPDATVIFNHGINDLSSIDQYIASYQMLIAAYPKAKIRIMAVNPVNKKLYKGYAKPVKIKAFNQKIQTAFPNFFIDTYQYLQTTGFNTADGLHYDSATYWNLYNYINQYL